MHRLLGWIAHVWRNRHDPRLWWLPFDPKEKITPLDTPPYAKAVDEAAHLADVANGTTLLDDRQLLTDDEKALFDQISPPAPEKVIAYPPPEEQSTQDWVTQRLQELTGGLTRHPADRTQYPTAPNEADLAAREMFPTSRFAMTFSKGMSMRYLGELQARARKRDRTLSAEDLMALRARGLA